jgi:hypothetical protein
MTWYGFRPHPGKTGGGQKPAFEVTGDARPEQTSGQAAHVSKERQNWRVSWTASTMFCS